MLIVRVRILDWQGAKVAVKRWDTQPKTYVVYVSKPNSPRHGTWTFLKGVSWLEVPNRGGLGRNQPYGDSKVLKVLAGVSYL